MVLVQRRSMCGCRHLNRNFSCSFILNFDFGGVSGRIMVPLQRGASGAKTFSGKFGPMVVN